MPREIDRRTFLHRSGLLGAAVLVGPGFLRGLGLPFDAAGTNEGVWLPPFSEGGPDFLPTTDEESKRYPTAVSVALLPDGRVLYWNGLEGTEDIEGSATQHGADWGGESRARILELAGGPSWSIPAPESGVAGDMFCSDQKNLPGGRIVIVGGTEWVHDLEVGEVALTELLGRQTTQIFHPRSDRFRPEQGMAKRRWYPSLITLADGRLLALSGVSKLLWNSQHAGDHGHEASGPLPQNVIEAEAFDPREGTWEMLPETANRSLPLYPRIHLMPDGRVLYTGAGQMWGPAGESYDQLVWNLTALLDPKTGQWEETGVPIYGARSGAFSVLLPLKPPYDTATVLVGGGTLGTSPGAVVATDLVELITQDADGSIKRTSGAPLTQRRWFSSPVLLPDGSVQVFSGGDVDHVVDPGAERAVKMTERYDPDTGTWEALSEGTRERTYHNSAVLLKDGSVLVGGHSPLPAHYGEHCTQPGSANNYKDPSFEIFRPAYLSRGRRPRIRRVYRKDSGHPVVVRVSSDAPIESAVLIRLPAQTHTVDADQRAVFLEVRKIPAPRTRKGRRKSGRWYAVEAPTSPAVLPPGTYFLFVNASSPDGPIPSVAETLSIR